MFSSLRCLTLSLLTAGIASHAIAGISLVPRGTYHTGVFDESAAEIVDFDPATNQAYVVNGDSDSIDVLDVSDIDNPVLKFSIDVSAYGSPNSVTVDPRKRIREIAVAVASDPVTDPGHVLFYTTDGTFLNSVEVGALPDMVTYSPFGFQLAVANEGESARDEDDNPIFSEDPEGSVSLITVFRGGKHVDADDVTTIDFKSLNGGVPEGVRIFPQAESIAQDLEPEYIAFSPWGNTLWVTLQEANAVAIVDAWSGELEKVVPLGTIDHSIPGFGLDASDRDDQINITNWPVKGMFMPDSIASYSFLGKPFYITANEGDDREFDAVRIKDLDLDPTAFPNADELQENEAIGRLSASIIDGDIDNDGDFDELYTYGTRSFSIWDRKGNLVFDSGDDFETITSLLLPVDFNSSNDDNDDFDSRSDAKGPEPEAVTVGTIRGRTYAFIGLERIGGIMVYDVTNPYDPEYIEYVNTRNFEVDADTPEAGDLGPEGLKFVPAHKSPTRKPLLLVASEVSGTTTIFEIESDRGWKWHRGFFGFVKRGWGHR
ncbi:choice-of-anchor I family protein [Pelagicoccus sp. SDUM812003]|uniref:choice-of-anchor I family protein n=1 Tax=Pelagicoccus sp. SDUM812003 TaxID=3041267 RepID=UPI00280D977C|nr:choice-of-anchor I family protein [Pelagicoccus sp. SDUM812003]MDQ8203749.1 choice-of-anchor I family protein [Pelagicoccus sp. SDUM812003]